MLSLSPITACCFCAPAPAKAAAKDAQQTTDLDVLIRAMRKAGAELFEQEREQSGWQPRPIKAEIWVPIGKESIDLQVAHLRLSRETPHALLIGGRRSGKTTALRSILLALARCYSAEQVRLIISDPRRSLRALSALPHTAHYAATEVDMRHVVESLQQVIDQPGDGQQRWVVAVDDYDIGYRQLESQFRSSYDQDANLFSVLKRLAAESEGTGPHLLIAANVKYPEEAGDVIKLLEAARNGLILWPHKYDGGTRLLDVGLPVGERDVDLPPGRALLVREGSSVLAQVAAVPQAEAAPYTALLPGDWPPGCDLLPAMRAG